MSARQKIPVWRKMPAAPAPGRNESLETIIVGAGPVGLTLALDLARRGRQITVVTRHDFIPAGSKAICFSKRTLDIWQRLGVAERMLARGVGWNVGKVFHGDAPEPIYQFDMLPVKHQQMPGFINLQQYYVEEILVDALQAYPNVALRWGHEVTAVIPRADDVRLSIQTEDSRYEVDARWVVACDGSRSPVRGMLGLDFAGRAFEDNFLIADIRVKDARPAERWFWFDPPFNPGKSALLHKQPDDVWRLDFQLGPGVDREACVRPENVEPLVRGMLGADVDFTPEWYSVYTFQCRRMDRFVHDRVIFAGDSAHLVSPFGARGCNGGVADADNLGWKLDLVLGGDAPPSLLESYDDEAVLTADENLRNSARSTDFMTPKGEGRQALRAAVLGLAAQYPFARPFVNSGRLSTAVAYPDSPLSTTDQEGDTWNGPPPGAVALDAPVAEGWLLSLLGDRFVLLANACPAVPPPGVDLLDVSGRDDVDLLLQRYDLSAGSAYLLRPDQYVSARWRNATTAGVARAMARATGVTP